MVEAKRAEQSMIYQAMVSYAYVALWITLSATGERLCGPVRPPVRLPDLLPRRFHTFSSADAPVPSAAQSSCTISERRLRIPRVLPA